MLRKHFAVLCLLFLTLPALAASNLAPVDCAQLMGWMAGGISGQSISHLVQDRGIAFVIHDGPNDNPNDDTAKTLLAVGADAKLIQSLRALHPSIIPANGSGSGPNC